MTPSLLRLVSDKDRAVLRVLAEANRPEPPKTVIDRAGIERYSATETVSPHLIKLAWLGLCQRLGHRRNSTWMITQSGREVLVGDGS